MKEIKSNHLVCPHKPTCIAKSSWSIRTTAHSGSTIFTNTAMVTSAQTI